MKVSTKDIAKKYSIDQFKFEYFLKVSDLNYIVDEYNDMSVVEELVDTYVDCYFSWWVEKEREAEEAKIEREEKRKATAGMLITSGFSFEGYRITKYSGYISGDDAISVDRGTAVFGGVGSANVKDKLMDSLVTIRRNALRELKEAAYDLGCNAVIGVDFDYLTLDPQTANLGGGTTYLPYVFGVTANGNAVVIEKIENE